MKKLNKKGMTLMELLVSVALMSIIMAFMYKLISDVRNEKKENDKIANNILKISEIEVESLNQILSRVPNGIDKVSEVTLSDSGYFVKNGKDYHITIYIRTNGGEIIRYSIGYLKKSLNQIYLKKVGATKTWTLNNWSLSEDIKNIKVEKKCDYTSKQLACEIDFNLLDANNKLVDTIVYPLYFYTDAFLDKIDNLDEYNNYK